MDYTIVDYVIRSLKKKQYKHWTLQIEDLLHTSSKYYFLCWVGIM